MITTYEGQDLKFQHDICIVGSGLIGLALALASLERGLRVLVLESGVRSPDDHHVDLGRAATYPPTHASLSEANCRALGGTSWWWGGRCIPFDPVDFESRPGVCDEPWPIPYEEVARYYPEAAAYFQCGGAGKFSMAGPWPALKGIRIDQVERWCNPNMAVTHRPTLETSTDLCIVLDATVMDLGLSEDGQSVSTVRVSNSNCTGCIEVNKLIIASGGVQTTRLLLSVQQLHPSLFSGRDGPLGRYYMGHIFGKIADLILNDPEDARVLDFFIDDGRYARRRFTFTSDESNRESLPNISFAAGNPRISDPAHRSGALSLIWFALASPVGKRLLPEALLSIYVGRERRYRAHTANIIRTLFPTLLAGLRIYRDKYMRKPGKPAIFLWNKGGRYTLHYHCEQMAEALNRITLSEEKDDLGMSRVDIAFEYSSTDAERVVRAHKALDRFLRVNNIGRLEFSHDRDALVQSVRDQARAGMHQIGSARMSASDRNGVVDQNCRAHGLDNLYVASTSVMPSSGNANPTFTGVALAIRLADHLAETSSKRSALQ